MTGHKWAPPLAIALALVVMLVARGGLAAPREAQAREAARASKHAMSDLFAAAKFDEARDALESTIKACTSCPPTSLATLRADLGIVYETGFQARARAVTEFEKARRLDPDVALDETFVTDEVRAAFAEAGRPTEQVALEEEPAPEERHASKHASTAGCEDDGDCDDGRTCRDRECRAPEPPPEAPSEPAVWLGVGLLQDFPFLSGSEACTRAAQTNDGYTCVRGSGSQYHGTPLGGQGGKLGGPAIGTTRLTLSTSFAVSTRLGLGVRVGYALFHLAPEPDGGKRFLPVYAELHGEYFLTGEAYSSRKVGTFVELAGGVAQASGSASVTVKENTAAPPAANQIDNPPQQTLEAHQSFGASFAGVGVGAFLPFAGRGALLADLRVSAFFPTSGAVVSLGLGGALGL